MYVATCETPSHITRNATYNKATGFNIKLGGFEMLTSGKNKCRNLMTHTFDNRVAISRTPFSENYLSSEFLFRSESSLLYVIALEANFYYFSLEHTEEDA